MDIIWTILILETLCLKLFTIKKRKNTKKKRKIKNVVTKN